MQFTVSNANNRLGVPGGQSGTMTYDNAGNLTNDTYTGVGNRTYDAEKRMTQAWGGNNQWQFYTYDAAGKRVRRKVDNIETWQAWVASYWPSMPPMPPSHRRRRSTAIGMDSC